MEKIQKCPLCGCTEIGKGKQTGHASMISVDSMFRSCSIIADICTECGYIISTRVEKPYKFKTKK